MNTTQAPSPAGEPVGYAPVKRRILLRLRAVVFRFSAIFALLHTYFLFKHLTTPIGTYPKLGSFIIAEYVLYAISVSILIFGIFSAVTQRLSAVRLYAMLCPIAYILLVVVNMLRYIAQIHYKNELMDGCVTLARYGKKGNAFGTWAASPPSPMNEMDAQDYCSSKWNHYVRIGDLATIGTILAFGWFMYAAMTYFMESIKPGYTPQPRLPSSDCKPPEYSYADGEMRYRDNKDEQEGGPVLHYDGARYPWRRKGI